MVGQAHRRGGAAVAVLALASASVGIFAPGASARTTGRRALAGCGPGARTLSRPGAILYPQAGNGGYRSVHTDVDIVDDAAVDRFLPGTHLVLHDRATRCLTALSLDFETHTDLHGGPDLRIGAVLIDDRPARWRLAVPTYPGDPKGPDDPDPRAHEASQHDPVGGPHHDPLPPACSPELPHGDSPADSQDGTRCPATKLVITPTRSIAAGARFAVQVDYTGRPGLHHDGDGTVEGWFRIPDGDFVTSEPLGTEDWMPVNAYPTAKPTYRFTVTAARGLNAIANGIRTSVRDDPADAAFPDGATTTVWNAAEPIAQYLPLVDVGDYGIVARRLADGMPFYRVQDLRIPAARQARNAKVIEDEPGVLRFEERLNGPYPFHSIGVVAGIPGAGDDTEEMETMISFTQGQVGLSTLYHESMHQWWGDNVTQASFNLTFFKEGMATFVQEALAALHSERRAGGPSTAAGRRAYDRSLTRQFNGYYLKMSRGFWHVAPSRPDTDQYFDSDSVYTRPSMAYIALRAILGPARFRAALHLVQRRYGGATITEPELEDAFIDELPQRTAACTARMHVFFTEWFDTAYPSGGTWRPQITGPGLAGPGFAGAGCR